MKRYLFLGAHTDDIELGAGATITKLIEQGNEVYYAAFSWGGNEVLINECQEACAILGCENIIILDFQVRRFNYHRQEILDKLIEIRNKLNPDVVFTHSSFDNHQDHRTLHYETLRAFPQKEILGYDLPWNCLNENLICPSHISSLNLDKKINALGRYETQKSKEYFNPDFIKALAVVRGIKFRLPLAEAFELIRATSI